MSSGAGSTGQVRGGTLVAEIIRAEGAPFVAGVVGGSLHEIVDGFVGMPEVRSILTRHERVATDIADGYSRTTGRVGIAMAVKGPGAANAFAGVANSYKDSVPILQIVGQVTQKIEGTDTVQELDLHDIFRSVSKWTPTIRSLERMPEIFRRAFTMLRSGRPRPVVVEIPGDVSAAYIDRAKVPYAPAPDGLLRSAGDPAEIERAAQLLLEAEQPLLYAGAGVLFSEAWEELRELAELLSAPVMTTLNAKGAFPEDHPLSLGLGGFPLGLYASRAALHFARRADVCLALGNSFKPSATRGMPRPDGTSLIHVDVDPAEINKIHVADVAIVGDARLVLRGLVDAIAGDRRLPRNGFDRDIVDAIAALKAEWLDEWMPLLTSDRKPIDPYRLTWDINNTVDRRNTIIMHDSGSVRGYLAHHYQAVEPRGFLGYGGQSSMGWSMGAAMGSKLGNPDKTVINYIGDGAFGMTGLDFQTAVRHEIPIITVVVNNGVLNMSMESRRQNFDGRYGDWIDLGETHYADLARAMGGWGERVVEPGEIVPALERAMKASEDGQPALLDVIVPPLVTEPILPDPDGVQHGRQVARIDPVPPHR